MYCYLNYIAGVIILITIITSCSKEELITEPSDNSGVFTDERDGQSYKWVKIGDQIWMAENFNFKTPSGSWFYDNDSAIGDSYGRLYDFETAKTIAPTGWHLPSKFEYEDLYRYLGGEDVAGGKIKSTGTNFWKPANISASNESGFNALPGGKMYEGSFVNMMQYCSFWTETEYNAHYFPYAYYTGARNSDGVALLNYMDRSNACSVRFIKDKEPITETTGTFIDERDGKEYGWVKIGEQVWMSENFTYTDVSLEYILNDDSLTDIYGHRYSRLEAEKYRPTGWHLPSRKEMEELIEYLGGIEVAGGKMKEEGTIHWNSPNSMATNESGFTALPGGNYFQSPSIGTDAVFISRSTNGGMKLKYWDGQCKIDSTHAGSVRYIKH